MKKLMTIVLSMAMMTIFAAPSFAMLRKDLASVKGTVVSVNSARTEITVKDMTTGKEVSFSSPGVPSEATTGKTVIVLYKKGTMNATTVRVVHKPGAITASAPAATTYQAPKTTAAKTATTTTTPEKSKYGW